jgi:hypothetical protein
MADVEEELKDPAFSEGAMRISTISNRASVPTTTDHAVRPISAVLRSCWLLSTTRTSKRIRSRSTSLSSGNDSCAMAIACWIKGRREQSIRTEIGQCRFSLGGECGGGWKDGEGTYVVGLPRDDVHHS